MKEATKTNVQLIGNRERQEKHGTEHYAVLVGNDYVGDVTRKEHGQMYELRTDYGAVRHFPSLDRLRAELSAVFNPSPG